MSAIRIYGDTSGYTEIAAPLVAGNNTLSLPSGNGTLLSVDGSQNISVSGIITASRFVGNVTGSASTASFATTSFGLSGSPNITVGIATASSFVGNLTGTATGLSGSPSITVNNIVGAAATFSGNVSIAGTLTYEDVTNVDSIGLVTARSGAHVATVSGNLLVGTSSSTGTASQPLQVTGGGYFSGNVGFGITNPVYKLQVAGSTVTRGLILDVTSINVGGFTRAQLNSSLAISNGSGVSAFAWNYSNGGGELDLFINRNGGASGGFYIYDAPNSTADPTLLMALRGDGNFLLGTSSPTGTASQPLQVTGGGYFSGSIGVGTTNPNGVSAQTSQLTLVGSNSGGGAGYHQFLTVSSTTATNPNKFFRLNSTGSIEIINSAYTTNLFTLDNSGNLTVSGNVTGYSDETLKDNVQTIPDALEKVVQLRGVEFDRNDIEGNPHQIGVIAQEVEKVIPEVVMTHEDGIKSVAYGNLVGLLIEAIKELKEEVNELKARLEEVQ